MWVKFYKFTIIGITFVILHYNQGNNIAQVLNIQKSGHFNCTETVWA